MRDSILLFVNGVERCVRGDASFASLASYLRGDLGLSATKVACAEGGCGACTVLVGRPCNGGLDYRTINSCIYFVYQLDAAHVVTAEGLAGGLRPVQEALVRGHGIQCGFCTPGFTMALTGMFARERRAHPNRSTPFNRAELQRGLSGNLCRCTGYEQILEASGSLEPRVVPPLDDRFPEAVIAGVLSRAAAEEVRLDANHGGRRRRAYLPVTLSDAVSLRSSQPDAAIVSGATRLGVEWNLSGCDPETILYLGKVADLAEVAVESDRVVAGACSTWSRILSCLEGVLPEGSALLERFGSPQIRNVASIAGNLANPSPIADLVPLLVVLGAEVELVGPAGVRRVAVEDFCCGDTGVDHARRALIARVLIPLPSPDAQLRCYKISKRRHLDLAALNAAFLVASEAGRVTRASIALGGAGPAVQRLHRTEAALVGRPVSKETFRDAGRIARREISPVGDVRGSAEFRLQLAENLLSKFFHEAST